MPASVLRVSGPSRAVPRDVTPPLPPPCSASASQNHTAPLAKQPRQFRLTPVTPQETLPNTSLGERNTRRPRHGAELLPAIQDPASRIQHRPEINAECSALGNFHASHPEKTLRSGCCGSRTPPWPCSPGSTAAVSKDDAIIRAANDPKPVKVPARHPAGTNTA